jgi:hypothetical protein
VEVKKALFEVVVGLAVVMDRILGDAWCDFEGKRSKWKMWNWEMMITDKQESQNLIITIYERCLDPCPLPPHLRTKNKYL